ncbi:organic solvent tolerance protein OstA [Halanaerobium sp. Z-7514]|uniref:Organic solvent tolerance protein OstA n=1 Tax=Halanaerobium polyolivorans TaxID=2886943 RepID=A0AAW4WXU4_9FIRM|nr:organic solvent tolerance protein OstA [Halanaerobium polyolivorans]MCC3144911.1 organic solvent tolerance protein OstA [Halanaerobium polyolivorans]
MNKKFIIILLILIVITISGSLGAARQLTGDELDFKESEAGQIIEARRNVELLYDELRITAEDLGIYHRYSGEIEFRYNVELFYQDYQGRAYELQGNIEEEVFYLEEDAVLEAEASYLEADRIKIYQAEERIEGHGNAYLEYENFWAEADQIISYLDREITHLSGNVRGERNGERFSADTAEINQAENEVRLRGQAKLSLPEEEASDDN